MYAHERTLLAKLGFADSDRREPLHQLACQYLATPEAVARLIPHFGLEHDPVPQEYQSSDSESFSELCRTVASYKASLEHEIAKGCDQYRTTIGFADLVLILSVEDKSFNIRRRSRTKWGGRDGWLWTDWHIGNDHIRSSVERCGIEGARGLVTGGGISTCTALRAAWMRSCLGRCLGNRIWPGPAAVMAASRV